MIVIPFNLVIMIKTLFSLGFWSWYASGIFADTKKCSNYVVRRIFTRMGYRHPIWTISIAKKSFRRSRFAYRGPEGRKYRESLFSRVAGEKQNRIFCLFPGVIGILQYNMIMVMMMMMMVMMMMMTMMIDDHIVSWWWWWEIITQYFLSPYNMVYFFQFWRHAQHVLLFNRFAQIYDRDIYESKAFFATTTRHQTPHDTTKWPNIPPKSVQHGSKMAKQWHPDCICSSCS